MKCNLKFRLSFLTEHIEKQVKEYLYYLLSKFFTGYWVAKSDFAHPRRCKRAKPIQRMFLRNY